MTHYIIVISHYTITSHNVMRCQSKRLPMRGSFRNLDSAGGSRRGLNEVRTERVIHHDVIDNMKGAVIET